MSPRAVTQASAVAALACALLLASAPTASAQDASQYGFVNALAPGAVRAQAGPDAYMASSPSPMASAASNATAAPMTMGSTNMTDNTT